MISSIEIRAQVNPNPAGYVYLNAWLPADATGHVNWYVDHAFVTQSGISNGLVQLENISISPSGDHLITATYSGDTNYEPSSAVIIQTAT